MTNQEAIEFGNMWLQINEDCKDSSTYTFFQMAIKALEQEPCEDAVSRQAVLNTLDNMDKALNEDRTVESYKALLKECYDVLPSVTPTQRWIPVSERLPEEFESVLCSTDAKEVFIAIYLGKMNDGTDCFDDDDGMMWEGDVIAWMPLPEPYKAESGEEKLKPCINYEDGCEEWVGCPCVHYKAEMESEE